jgi:alpha-1,2-mannosyltransferase
LTEPSRSDPLTKRRVSWSRLLALVTGAAIAAPSVAVSLTALGAPAIAAHAMAAILVIAGAALAHVKAPAELAALGKGARVLFALWLLLAAGAVYRVSSLSLFIDDVSRTEHAYQRQIRELDNPELTKPFFLKHNCSTCYLVAAHLAGSGVENLYDKKYYRRVEVRTPVHDEIGDAFNVDQYQYPPPFLLGPYLALLTGLDFFQIRALWFAFSVILFVITSAAITVWICGWKFHALWLIWPAMLVAPTVIATLQIGNAHAFMILIATLAMVFFEKRWNVIGGGLLAYATLSKFFPGILVAYLLFRRKWRALAWTAAWTAVLCIATLLAFGVAPFKAFLGHQLPGLASGDAFSFAFTLPVGILANSSIMGIPFKLEALGVASPWEPKTVARVLTWIYTLVVFAVVVLAARRHEAGGSRGRDSETTEEARLFTARLWVALIVLAQLRSPFLPGVYGNTAILLLLALLLPLNGARPIRLVLIAVGVLAFAAVVPLPLGPVSSAFDYAFSTIATLFAAGLAITVALRQRLPSAVFGESYERGVSS